MIKKKLYSSLKNCKNIFYLCQNNKAFDDKKKDILIYAENLISNFSKIKKSNKKDIHEYHLTPFSYNIVLLQKRLEEVTRNFESKLTKSLPLDEEAFQDNLINTTPFHLSTETWLHKCLLTTRTRHKSECAFSKVFWKETGMGSPDKSRNNIFLNVLRTQGVYLPDISSKTFIDYDYKIDRKYGIASSSFFIPSVIFSLAEFRKKFSPELLGAFLWFVYFHRSFLPDKKLVKKYGHETSFKRLFSFSEKDEAENKRSALILVKDTLEEVLYSNGKDAMDAYWQRIWDGFSILFILSTMNEELEERRALINSLSAKEKFIEIIKEKAYLSSFAHGDLSLRGRTLNDWFMDPEEFVDTLEKCSHLVIPGSPEESRFLTDLVSFEGPMFKIFSDNELTIISQWIQEICFEEQYSGDENHPDIPVNVEIKSISPDVKQFVFTPKANQNLPSFTPGSYISVMFGPENCRMIRQYSLVNSYEEKNKYTILVRYTKESKGGSRYLHESLGANDEVFISKPVNNFKLVEKARKYIFLAGGIGITPFISYLSLLEKSTIDFEVHYGIRDIEHGPLVFELKDRLKEKLSLYDLSKGEMMDIKHLISEQIIGTHLYVCGPEKMITSTVDIAKEIGWNSSHIHFELFSQDCSGEEFDVYLKRSNRKIIIPNKKSILEVLESNGIRHPHHCRSGNCGKCVANVIKGDIDHRDNCLSDNDRKNKMAVCVSRSVDRRMITLDL
tara:strand:+ start:1582 stop:3765 length:2184 start_codon:yes stop_codon:yes gene_type:complete